MQVGFPPPQSARSQKLERRIRASIEADGPMPFGTFMERALYEPGLGYYRSEDLPWGSGGDYVTAPQVHPALGQSIARYCVELDAALGHPDPFLAVEVGSGNGALAAAFLNTVRRDAEGLWRRMRFQSVERGPAARAAQALPEPGRGLALVEDVSELPDEFAGLLYGNELLDAFPVERVSCRGGELVQSYVVAGEGGLAERFGAVEDRVREHLERNEIRLREGQVAEMCLDVEPWVATVAARLRAGGMLLVDYGHDTGGLYGESRQHGTLVAQQRFALSDDVLARPGDRDLTAHVDWGNLRRLAEAKGFEWAGECSLGVFLIGMEAAADLPDADPADRLALRHLLVSEIAEAHRVVAMHRGLSGGMPAFGRERLG